MKDQRTMMWARTGAAMTALVVTLGVLLAVQSPPAAAQKIYSGSFKQESGEDLFKSICQGCHMPDAKGAVGAGAYPALASNIRLAAAAYPINVVVNGQRAMPDFGADLTDAQIASVINYVRTHFGNRYKDVVTPEAVKAMRR